MHGTHCSELDKQLKTLEGEYLGNRDSLQELETKRQKLEQEKYSHDGELDKQRAVFDEKERDFDSLMKEYEFAKEREAVLYGDR